MCGSDGATYPNRCKLEMKNCEMDTEVYVKHSSECKLQVYHLSIQQYHVCILYATIVSLSTVFPFGIERVS